MTHLQTKKDWRLFAISRSQFELLKTSKLEGRLFSLKEDDNLFSVAFSTEIIDQNGIKEIIEFFKLK